MNVDDYLNQDEIFNDNKVDMNIDITVESYVTIDFNVVVKIHGAIVNGVNF